MITATTEQRREAVKKAVLAHYKNFDMEQWANDVSAYNNALQRQGGCGTSLCLAGFCAFAAGETISRANEELYISVQGKHIMDWARGYLDLTRNAFFGNQWSNDLREEYITFKSNTKYSASDKEIDRLSGILDRVFADNTRPTVEEPDAMV